MPIEDSRVYPLAATLAVVVVVAIFAAGYFGWSLGMRGAAPATSSGSASPSYLYLTVNLNPVTGWPQYTPANFTVPKGEVVVTIYDFDAPASWASCPCNVTGVVGNEESVNGTWTSQLPSSNVAHTFGIPSLGLFVISPGMSTVTFTAWFNTPGAYTWMCVTPCGTQGYTGGAMSVAGYMSGTMTVAP